MSPETESRNAGPEVDERLKAERIHGFDLAHLFQLTPGAAPS